MSRRDDLDELKAYLDRQMAEADPKSAAGLVKAQLDVLKQLDELRDVEEADPVEQLLARNTARGAGSVASIASGRRGGTRRRGGRAAS